MNIATIIGLILGSTEGIVPIFIHNPKSQAIEGVIVTTINGVIGAIEQATAPTTPKA